MEGYILIVDDEKVFRDTLAKVLIEEGYEVVTAPNGEIKSGAYDYIVKPIIFDEVLVKVKKIMGIQKISRDNQRLRAEIGERFDFGNIVGISPKISALLNLVKKVSPTKSTVLITGESGTGKELIACAVHQNSPRNNENFISINCAAIPENLLESELFGHVKGAFTGAQADKKGLFKIADGGSLFLDEVAELPLKLQVKLLRVVEDGEVLPVGGVKPIKTDTRLIAATARDLSKEVEKGNFREELFYRLNVIEIVLPPLRERKEDIPLLVNYFVDKLNMGLRKRMGGVDPKAMEILLSYSWKGNIRELKNVIERAMILCEGDIIMPCDLPSLLSGGKGDIEKEKESLKEILREYERGHIIKILEKTGHDKKEAARLLGLSLSSLYRKIEELAIPQI